MENNHIEQDVNDNSLNKDQAVLSLEECHRLALELEDNLARIRQNSDIDVSDIESDAQSLTNDIQDLLDELEDSDMEE